MLYLSGSQPGVREKYEGVRQKLKVVNENAHKMALIILQWGT